VVKFSAVASCASVHAGLEPAQRTTKGWHTAVDQQITSSGFGNTLKNEGGSGGKL
jgi:hypothetical protein